MQFRLRTLLIVLAVGPVLACVTWWVYFVAGVIEWLALTS